MTRRVTFKSLRGQALVEFAIILPVMLLMFMGVWDLGRGIFAYNEVSNAAREAARTGIVNQNPNDIAGRAAQQALSLGLSSTPAPTNKCPSPDGPTFLDSGTCVNFLKDDLSTDCSSSLSVGCVVDVTVKYSYTPITPIISNIIGSLTLTSTSREAIESVCQGAGCPVR
jgi:Flp pilus assembly protein TadG